MTLVQLLIFGLATWRIASLFATEIGPFDIFLKIREFSGITHDANKEVAMIPEKFFPQMISCVWCNSIYIAAFWTITFLALGEIAVYLALPLALSAMAIIFNKTQA